MNQHTGWETAERTHTKPECTRTVTAGSFPAQRAGGRRFCCCFHEKKKTIPVRFLRSLPLHRDGQMSVRMETLTLSGKFLRAIAHLLNMFRFLPMASPFLSGRFYFTFSKLKSGGLYGF
jgi:hypothetical protein